MDIFLLRLSGSGVLEGAPVRTAELAVLGFSTTFIRELAVVAMETGGRGRELLRGGDSFGGGTAT